MITSISPEHHIRNSKEVHYLPLIIKIAFKYIDKEMLRKKYIHHIVDPNQSPCANHQFGYPSEMRNRSDTEGLSEGSKDCT